RLLAGAALGKPFEDPVEVKGLGHIGDRSRVDEWAAASLKFPGGIVAELSTGVRVHQENVVWVYGAKGRILVPWPWIPGREGQASRILLYREGKDEPEEIVIEPGAWLYALEADTVARHLADRQPAPPAMTWDDTLGNMKTLDLWRQSFGFEYDMERPTAQTQPVSRHSLRVRTDHPMKYGDISGVKLSVARIVMGVDNQQTMPHAAVMFDGYFERGGNAFDTAYIYHGGLCERLLGHWLKSRGVRDQVVLIGKGAHTPMCFPAKLREQLTETLSRLQTDHVDLYLAHRDNPEVPVDEWAEAFNELLREGLIHAYGGSNWSLARVQALNSYAETNGLTPVSVVSNQFSLARMVEPVWSGCLSASDRDSRNWFENTQMALLPWSSQARGFFTDRAAPDQHKDAELVRCWYSEDNFERQDRARKLGAKKGLPPIVIALAYVLNQSFPTFPLIGPRTLQELQLSMQALPVLLTAGEIAWLNLET
ncbi:MAG: aldo/keto reductase, partial [Armatimonadetes bacterium]|nr:aldo/keto reductase [Armatimonadota bacterium]